MAERSLGGRLGAISSSFSGLPRVHSLAALFEERRPHPPKPKEIEIFAPGLGALPKFLKGPFARGCGDVASP